MQIEVSSDGDEGAIVLHVEVEGIGGMVVGGWCIEVSESFGQWCLGVEA